MTDSLIFDSVSVKPTLSSSAGLFGGLVGIFGGTSPVYMQCTGNNKITVSSPTNTDDFGGILGSMGENGSFLDVGGEVTVSANNYKGGGIVCTANSGVIRFSGITDLSNAKAGNGAQLVKTRGKTLIYSPGSGSDDTWTFRRSSTPAEVDDIDTWGEVFRNSKNAAYTGVINETTHSVTLYSAVNPMSSTTQFVRTALNIQLNDGINIGALNFEDRTNSKKDTLLSSNLSLIEDTAHELTGDVDLSGTGITGLTRDNGENSAFTKTFNGNNKTITLAIGETYGKRGGSTIDAGISGSGMIYRHKYNGLFAKVSGAADIQNLTLNGNVFVSAMVDNVYTGGAAAYVGGDTTFSGINANAAIKTDNTKNAQNATTITGGIAGYIDGCVVNISSCNVNGSITVNGNNEASLAVGGICGVLNSGTLTLTTVAAKQTMTADGGAASVGGILGRSDSSSINMNSVEFDGTVLDLVSKDASGALIGHKLNKTNVTFAKDGAVVKNNTHIKGTSKNLLKSKWKGDIIKV